MAIAPRAPTRAPIAMPALAPAEKAGPREGGARAYARVKTCVLMMLIEAFAGLGEFVGGMRGRGGVL